MTDFVINPTPPDAEFVLSADVDTIVEVLLDGSYSMDSIKTPTVTGLNEYLGSLPKSKPNSTTLVNLTVFRGGSDLAKMRSYENIDTVKLVDAAEYVPNGGTPLLASIYHRLIALDKVLKTSTTPPAVLFVIMTDGEENISMHDTVFAKEVTASAKKDDTTGGRSLIKKMIEERSASGWTFVFLGANQDAFHEGASFGISKGNTVNFSADASREAFAIAGAASSAHIMSNSVLRSTDKSMRYSTSTAYDEAGIDNTETVTKK